MGFNSGFKGLILNLPIQTHVKNLNVNQCKGKTIPVQAWKIPEVSRKLRLLDIMRVCT